MPESLKHALIRAARTYAQVFIGLLLAQWSGEMVGWETGLSLLRAAALGAVPAVLALVQNWLEEASPVNLGPRA